MRSLRRGTGLALLALAAATLAARAESPAPADPWAGAPAAPVPARSPLALGWDAPVVLDRALPPEPAAEPAPLALANPYLRAPAPEANRADARTSVSAGRSPRGRGGRRMPQLALTPERAQALLRSLTVPGWGQATLGHRTAGAVFGIIESGVWGSFTAFRIQEHLRREASGRTARIFAGVELAGRDEEFRRLVGAFASSDEYNLLVVARDAANLFYDEPERYRDYIATHSLTGANGWSWRDEASFLRYRAQRKEAHRAALRANTALAVAVGNRILSVLHTARVAGRPRASAADPPRTWNLEVRPAGGEDPTAYRFGLRANF